VVRTASSIPEIVLWILFVFLRAFVVRILIFRDQISM
jgi:hypothetical protein